MLAYIDFFLGGDEKRPDLPPRLHQRFPMSLLFGGDGSYMTPYSLQNDNIMTSLMSQVCFSSHPGTANCFYKKFKEDNSFLFIIRKHNSTGLHLLFQCVPPTTWYRFVAGLNAQLRLVRRGCLRVKFRPVIQWLETFANPALRTYGMHVDLAWFQATSNGYCHYGLLMYAVEDEVDNVLLGYPDGVTGNEHSRYSSYH